MQRFHQPQQAANWLRAQVQGALQTDSRCVGQGDGFIAWPGGVNDARAYVPAVLSQGAKACLVEARGLSDHAWAGQVGDAVAAYEGLKADSGHIASAYYEHPSHALDVMAVTGTNGKTSTVWWLAHALQHLGCRSALVGTLGVGQVDQLEVTGMTTPDPVLLQARLRHMVDAGVQACAIEASSIGLAEHRLAGTRVRVAFFTNFTQDHLDYHGDMGQYWQAKRALFDWQGLQAVVINVDDPQGASLAHELQTRGDVTVWTVACDRIHEGAHHLQATQITHGEQGLCFELTGQGQRHALATRWIGSYNVSNLLGVIAGLCALGFDLAQAVQACAHLPAVPGRMQALGGTQQPLVVIDYAHTPDAVAHAVQALQPVAAVRGGELVCLLGCGGDRDAGKRPQMAVAATQHAQRVVLTSDNPRSEDPQRIIDQMLMGLTDRQAVQVVLDRAQAIAQTVHAAEPQDVILIAGKGHEDYQEIAGVKHPFSDVTHAQQALQSWRAHV